MVCGSAKLFHLWIRIWKGVNLFTIGIQDGFTAASARSLTLLKSGDYQVRKNIAIVTFNDQVRRAGYMNTFLNKERYSCLDDAPMDSWALCESDS